MPTVDSDLRDYILTMLHPDFPQPLRVIAENVADATAQRDAVASYNEVSTELRRMQRDGLAEYRRRTWDSPAGWVSTDNDLK